MIKAAWITGGCMILAAIIYGLFGLFDNKTKNESEINQTIVISDLNINIVTNYQNDIKGDYEKGDKKVNIQDSKLENSPIIVDSPGAIVGDNNVINKLDIPEPNFLYNEIYRNKFITQYETYGDRIPYQNVYETKLKLTIESKTALNFIRLIGNSQTVLDITALMMGTTFWNTGTGTYLDEEIRYFKITNPVGPYEVKVITNKPIDSTFYPTITL